MQLTLMTAKTDYTVGEPIHVLHVLDASMPGRGVYIMGPKRPTGEYLDGKLATEAPEIPDYPWVATYDGVVLESPAIDYNYDVTSYRFDEAERCAASSIRKLRRCHTTSRSACGSNSNCLG